MLATTVEKYIRLLGIKCDMDRLKTALITDPSYPSLLSLKKALAFIGIEAEMGRCDIDFLKSLNTPFMVHLTKGDSQSLTLAKWKDNTLYLFALSENKWLPVEIALFIQRWDGITVVFKSVSKSTLSDHLAKFTLFLIISVIAGLLVFKFGWEVSPLVLGLIIALLQFVNSLGISTSITESLCSINSYVDCKKVANSSFASIFGIPMAVLSLSYFGSQLLVILIYTSASLHGLIQSLYLPSAVIFLPLCVYSLYGQIRIGKFCMLCILTLLCLGVETLIFLLHLGPTLNFNFYPRWIGYGLTVFLISQLTYLLFQTNNQLKRLGLKFLSFKRRIKCIENNRQSPKQIAGGLKIREGNNNVDAQITAFLSPSCSHCRSVLGKLLKLEEVKKGKVSISVILGLSSPDDMPRIQHWIEVYKKGNVFFQEFINSWIRGKDTIPLIKEDRLFDEHLNNFSLLCKSYHISEYPQIILNGQPLSSYYEPEDLDYLILDYQLK